jgi:hypothetical protein
VKRLLLAMLIRDLLAEVYTVGFIHGYEKAQQQQQQQQQPEPGQVEGVYEFGLN